MSHQQEDEADDADAAALLALRRLGVAVLPPGFVGGAVLEGLRRESEAALEDSLPAAAAAGPSVARAAAAAIGCVFPVLPRVASGSSKHPARRDARAYFHARGEWPHSAEAAAWLRCPRLLGLVRAALHGGGGGDVFLFGEQHLIKLPAAAAAAERSSQGDDATAFGWHYDSAACGPTAGAEGYAPYASLWVALDDMGRRNGALVVAPGCFADAPSHAAAPPAPPAPAAADDGTACGRATMGQEQQQQKHQQQHRVLPPEDLRGAPVRWVRVADSRGLWAAVDEARRQQQQQQHQQHQEQQAEGVPPPPAAAAAATAGFFFPLGLLLPAGASVLFLDTLWHCSGANESRTHTRRAYMAQFCARPMTWRASGELVGLAVPLWEGTPAAREEETPAA